MASLVIAATAFAAVAPAANAAFIHIAPIYDAGISAADMTVIQSAINFYNTNITTPVSLSFTIAFGTQAGGGASTTTFNDSVSYGSYLAALTLTQTSANDATALATLPVSLLNPVTGSTDVELRSTLATGLGLEAAPTTGAFADCGGHVSNRRVLRHFFS